MGLQDSYCNLYPKAYYLISQKDQNDAQFSRSQDDVIFNKTTGDYNLDNLIVFFNPTYNQDIVLLLLIEFNSVSFPQSEESHPFLTYNYVTNYQLHADLKTFSFKLGGFFNQSLGGCVFYDTFNIILNVFGSSNLQLQR
ncbi:unnamed protein product [Paramecium primaurelia]|uniref:Uncharacterized protein n=1 Tax=Paramecium primaurelia TaxID=5886 RepID=A0A8S1MIH4_PARPR|nr:unnamed protein product [Paramecium primaurelia]